MRTIAVLLLLAFPAAAHAQMAMHDSTPCPAIHTDALPSELKAFNDHGPVIATGAAITPDDPLLLQLAPQTGAPPPGHAAVPSPYAGIVRLQVDRSGTFRVALSAAAWIEVARGGLAVASVAHTPGPHCSGIRKIVDFSLTPGTYEIRLSNSPAERLRLLVARKP